MNANKMYGIWNNRKKEFQFGIEEPSKRRAEKALFRKIGKDGYKWRFEIREIKPNSPKQTPPSVLRKMAKTSARLV